MRFVASSRIESADNAISVEHHVWFMCDIGILRETLSKRGLFAGNFRMSKGFISSHLLSQK